MKYSTAHLKKAVVCIFNLPWDGVNMFKPFMFFNSQLMLNIEMRIFIQKEFVNRIIYEKIEVFGYHAIDL
jgi:hypothetical protein